MECFDARYDDRICGICKRIDDEKYNLCKELVDIRNNWSKRKECKYCVVKSSYGTNDLGYDESYDELLCEKKNERCWAEEDCLKYFK